jgi:hypothetical protein
MQLEKATSHSSEAGLAGWISSNDVTLFTVVLVVVIAIFLQANVIKGSKENKSLAALHRKEQEQIQQILAQLSATQDDLASQKNELAKKETDLTATRRSLEAVRKLLEDTQRQLDATSKDVESLRKTLAALNVERDNLLAATKQLGEDKSRLSKDKETLTKTKADLDASLADLTARLQERLKDLDDLRRERDLLNQQATALNERLQRLEAQLAGNRKEMTDLKKTTDTETASLKELLARALEQAKTEKATSEKDLLAANARVAEIDAKAKEASAKAADYLDRLQRAATFVRGVDEKKRLLELEIQALKVQLANALDRLKNSQEQLVQRRSAEKTVRQELIGLAGKLRRVAIVFDSSGSMNEGGRWDEVQRITATWLQHLEFDQCVLIVFSSGVAVYPPDGSLVSVTGPQGEANRAQLQAYLKAIKPEGWTNTLAAMRAAYRYPDLDTIILFSDGAPTYENSNKFSAEVAQEIYALCRQRANIPVNTIGVGNYFDRDLSTFLRTVAQLSGGTFLGR